MADQTELSRWSTLSPSTACELECMVKSDTITPGYRYLWMIDPEALTAPRLLEGLKTLLVLILYSPTASNRHDQSS